MNGQKISIISKHRAVFMDIRVSKIEWEAFALPRYCVYHLFNLVCISFAISRNFQINTQYRRNKHNKKKLNWTEIQSTFDQISYFFPPNKYPMFKDLRSFQMNLPLSAWKKWFAALEKKNRREKSQQKRYQRKTKLYEQLFSLFLWICHHSN